MFSGLQKRLTKGDKNLALFLFNIENVSKGLNWNHYIYYILLKIYKNFLFKLFYI